jgi:hypothetical protein
LKEEGVFREAPPFAVGHAVVFPDDRLGDRLPANVHPAIVFEADSLRLMKGAVTRALEHWCRVPNPYPMSEELRADILESLTPLFHLIPVLWRSVDKQEAKLHRLTQNQTMILEMLQKERRVAIEGVAGSGKTLLAMAQAQRYAREGKKTLLVCFNEPLATSLDGEIHPRYRDRIEVRTFHQVCREFCREAQVSFVPDAEGEFWTTTAAELLDAAAEQVADTCGYDAIVVDEAQDFSELWWICLEKVYRTQEGPGPLVAFFDPRQCIYLDEPAIPADLSGPYILPTNCRNTRRIADFCAEILDFEPTCHPDAPEGEAPGQRKAKDLAGVIEETRKVVQGWCLRERGGLEPKQVAILTHRNNHKEWPKSFGNLRVYRSFDAWRENKGVLLATHRRFKGLEAAALVLAGVPEPGSTRAYTHEDHYVACSRARHVLEVITLPTKSDGPGADD